MRALLVLSLVLCACWSEKPYVQERSQLDVFCDECLRRCGAKMKRCGVEFSGYMCECAQ